MNERPVVVAIDEQASVAVDTKRWSALATRVLADENVSGPAELNLTFVDAQAMTELNENHMGGSGPTDVLSFPLDDDTAAVFDGQVRLLGDVVICPSVAVEQAPGELEDELALMVVHGVLHILGMDHAEADEAAAMRSAEQAHMTAWKKGSTIGR